MAWGRLRESFLRRGDPVNSVWLCFPLWMTLPMVHRSCYHIAPTPTAQGSLINKSMSATLGEAQ